MEFVDIGEGVGERHELPPSTGFAKIFFSRLFADGVERPFVGASPRKMGCRISDLEYLFNLGRQAGDAWIAQNGDALGQRSTMDAAGSIWDNI